jgi:hypothetical protein
MPVIIMTTKCLPSVRWSRSHASLAIQIAGLRMYVAGRAGSAMLNLNVESTTAHPIKLALDNSTVDSSVGVVITEVITS